MELTKVKSGGLAPSFVEEYEYDGDCTATVYGGASFVIAPMDLNRSIPGIGGIKLYIKDQIPVNSCPACGASSGVTLITFKDSKLAQYCCPTCEQYSWVRVSTDV